MCNSAIKPYILMDNPFLVIEQRLIVIEQNLNHLLTTFKTSSEVQHEPLDERKKLSISDLSAYLNVSKSTIHRYKNNRIFPFYQAGRTVFFKKNEVDKAMLALKSSRIQKH